MTANASYPLNYLRTWRYYLSSFYKPITEDSYELSPSALWIINQTFLFFSVNDVDINNILLKLNQKQFMHISKHNEIPLHSHYSHQRIRKARQAGNQIMQQVSELIWMSEVKCFLTLREYHKIKWLGIVMWNKDPPHSNMFHNAFAAKTDSNKPYIFRHSLYLVEETETQAVLSFIIRFVNKEWALPHNRYCISNRHRGNDDMNSLMDGNGLTIFYCQWRGCWWPVTKGAREPSDMVLANSPGMFRFQPHGNVSN